MRKILLAGVLCVITFALVGDAVAENRQCEDGTFYLADPWSTFSTRLDGYCVDRVTQEFIGYLANGDSLVKPIDQVHGLRDSHGHKVDLAVSQFTPATTSLSHEPLTQAPQYEADTKKVQCQEGEFSLGDPASSIRTRLKGYCVRWEARKFVGYLVNGDSLVRPLRRIVDLRDAQGHRIALTRPAPVSAPVDSLLGAANRTGAASEPHLGYHVLRVGIHGGYSLTGGVQSPSFVPGAQVMLSFSRNFGIEVAASRYRDKFKDRATGASVERDLTTVGVSIVVSSSDSNDVSVYGLGGLNYGNPSYRTTPVPYDTKLETESSNGYHIGGGIRLGLSKHVEFFAEYRYVRVLFVSNWVGEGPLFEKPNFGLAKFGLNARF